MCALVPAVGLLDEIARESKSDPRRGCSLGRALTVMDPQDAADVVAALDDAAFTNAAISRVLCNRALDISQQTVARHRRGFCACDR